MSDANFARELIDRFDGWVEDLTARFRPLRAVPEGEDLLRLLFRVHGPHAVIVGKLIRAVSGIRAALHLADVGYVAECAALLRVVCNFCAEVTAIAEALHRGGPPPAAVREFVDQYFLPRARTPKEYEESERIRYVSREELMKADVRMEESTHIDGEKVRALRRFLNMGGDAYVHGAYETTMELFNPQTARFEMRGHPDAGKREEFVEAVFLRSHEVVVAIELAAAVIGDAAVFEAARAARRRMDTLEPWKIDADLAASVLR